MKNFVGVLSRFEFDKVSMKQLALMFSQVAVSEAEKSVEYFLEVNKTWPSVLKLKWLLEQGIVIDPYTMPTHSISLKNNEKHLSENLENLDQLFTKERQDISRNATPENILFTILSGNALREDFEKRRISIILRELYNINAVPATTSRFFLDQNTTTEVTRAMQITLKAIPVPDYSTSWEQIFEYRSDPSSHSKFLALRNWMSDMARSNLTPIEIEQKLEYLMDQYHQHMQLHKMKTNAGVLQTVVVSTAELMEDLLRFKWGKLAKSMFSLRERKITLLEGELKSPGNEVAYIVKVREAFNK